jgi:hypothetical protein
MGVALGQFEPTDALPHWKPARDGAGKEQPDTRYLEGVCARTADGIALFVRTLQFGNMAKLTIHLGGKSSTLRMSSHLTKNSFRTT